MGTALTLADDALHPAGSEPNWNESRYLDFFDVTLGLAGWLRLGQRVNAQQAELSVCVHLPDGGTAFGYSRLPMQRMSDDAGGLSFDVRRPFEHCRVRFDGNLSLLPRPQDLLDPGRALRESPRVPVSLQLEVYGRGLASVLGADQDDVAAIFLPGQALAHFQHLVRSEGSVKVGERRWHVSGRGARDQSWGPRDWHAKQWFRWLCGAIDDDDGFMLTRSLGHGGASRIGGFMRERGRYRRITAIDLRTVRGDHHFQQRIDVDFRGDGQRWCATGEAMAKLPLRHRQKGSDGTEAELRIVKAPTCWTLDDGREACGISEYHDLMVEGVPIGLAF
jgi:hypothetical protein